MPSAQNSDWHSVSTQSMGVVFSFFLLVSCLNRLLSNNLMLYDRNGTFFLFSLIKALHVVLIRNEDLSKGQWSTLIMMALELN